MRPNEISESALWAAVNAVSAATVAPGASPRAFSAALSRSSASFSLRGLLSAMQMLDAREHIRPVPVSNAGSSTLGHADSQAGFPGHAWVPWGPQYRSDQA